MCHISNVELQPTPCLLWWSLFYKLYKINGSFFRVNKWRQWNKVSEWGKLIKHLINKLWSKLSQVWVTDWEMSVFVILNTWHISDIYGYIEDTCCSFYHVVHSLMQIPLYGPCGKETMQASSVCFCHSDTGACIINVPYHLIHTSWALWHFSQRSWTCQKCHNAHVIFGNWRARGNGGGLPWVGKKWYKRWKQCLLLSQDELVN